MKTHASRLSQNGLLPRREFINIYERVHFLSMASAAENFRSTCGPERRAPECSTQRSPAETPQVGQGTADICSGVSSFFFIPTQCENIGRKTVQFCTLLRISRHLSEDAAFPYMARDLIQSCKTTLRRELFTWIEPLYWIKPSFLNLFMKKLTRDRVVPIISAYISCDTLGSTFLGSPGLP